MVRRGVPVVAPVMRAADAAAARLIDDTKAVDPVTTDAALRLAATSAVFVSGADAGVVLVPDGGVARLPGLRDDDLLDAHSALLNAARDALDEGRPYSSFLWPRSARHAPDEFVRVTVLACEQHDDAVACGVVVLSPARHLRGLTPRELEVLGHVIEGCSNLEIARALVVAPCTVAAHLEHILIKLDATSRALAAVRAERAGLYVPLTPTRTP